MVSVLSVFCFHVCYTLEPSALVRRSSREIQSDGTISRHARDSAVTGVAISPDGSTEILIGKSHVMNPSSDAAMVVQTGGSDVTDVSSDSSMVVQIGASYATNVSSDGSMVVQIGENDVTTAPECSDDGPRRRNGKACKDGCYFVPRSRRRRWGGETKDTCKKTCNLCQAPTGAPIPAPTPAPTGAPIPATTPVAPTQPIIATAAPTPATTSPSSTWQVVAGGCSVVDGTCVSSPNFPSDYSSKEKCTFSQSGTSQIDVLAFETEKRYDKLTVNGIAYSGASIPPADAPSENIVWSTDGYTQKKGWKICFKGTQEMPATPSPTPASTPHPYGGGASRRRRTGGSPYHRRRSPYH